LIEGEHRPGLLSWASPFASVAAFFLGVIALFALTSYPALGYDSVVSEGDGQGETVTGSIVLDVYLDSEGRALIVGYLVAEDPEYLAFIESSEYVHDEDTGELYALNSGLTSILGEKTELEFEAEAVWDECHLVFYLPANAELLSVSCSEGLDYTVAEAEDSLVVEVLGYELDGAEVAIDYELSG